MPTVAGVLQCLFLVKWGKNTLITRRIRGGPMPETGPGTPTRGIVSHTVSRTLCRMKHAGFAYGVYKGLGSTSSFCGDASPLYAANIAEVYGVYTTGLTCSRSLGNGGGTPSRRDIRLTLECLSGPFFRGLCSRSVLRTTGAVSNQPGGGA